MAVDRHARVVVLGAGFGGLTFCQHFRHPAAQVTVVDRTNHHLFQPLLYQVAVAGLSAPDIAQPIRSILARTPRSEVVLEDVREVDLAARRVVCANKVLPYDYLVLALGSVTSYYGHPEWAEFAPGLKTLEDALLIRRNLLLAFEKAENSTDPAEQARLMTIVIVGGGPTGVELAGACAELARHVLRRDFGHIDPAQARIVLIEAAPRILANLPPDLSDSGQRQLENLGVQVRTATRVKAIRAGCVELENGETIAAENILWAAGVMAHPLTRSLGVELDRAGRIKVTPDLSVPGHPEVFALGDMALALDERGAPVPGIAPAAMQMARHVARLIADELDLGKGRAPRPPFRYRDRGTMATIGRSAGAAIIGKVKLTGFPAWLAWLVVHLIFLIGFRNKLVVLLSWTYSYFTYKLGARIITGWPRTQPEESPPG
ncbi:MAG: NAD(P)/FAD-dependent oxidoreductase [Verrucomicrobia bacterium]|nr:NAD(P)/FAD-dependent oxidoreductase [Verrucomicrobiota bacterium]